MRAFRVRVSPPAGFGVYAESRPAETFFSFNDKLDELCVAVEGKITADTEEKIIALIDGITAELILPQKEKAVV